MVVDTLCVKISFDSNAATAVVDHDTVVAFPPSHGACDSRVASDLHLHNKVTLGGLVERHTGRVPPVPVVVMPVLAVKRSDVMVTGGTAISRALRYIFNVEVQRVVATVEF